MACADIAPDSFLYANPGMRCYCSTCKAWSSNRARGTKINQPIPWVSAIILGFCHKEGIMNRRNGRVVSVSVARLESCLWQSSRCASPAGVIYEYREFEFNCVSFIDRDLISSGNSRKCAQSRARPDGIRGIPASTESVSCRK